MTKVLLVTVFLLAFKASAARVTLAWDASPSPVVSYVLHHSSVDGQYSSPVGNSLTVTVDGLRDGVTYVFTVTAKDAAGVESDPSNPLSYSVPPVVVIPPLPPTWDSDGVGAVLKPGGVTYTNNTFTVEGAGEIGGRSDAFYFVHQPLSADGEITARIVALERGYACVMVRETLAANSRYVAIGVDESLKFREQHRSKTGNRTSSTTSSLAGYLPNLWVRIRRTGNSFACYRSTDGASWVKMTTPSVTMSSEALIGLAVASGSFSSTETADFAQVTVTP